MAASRMKSETVLFEIISESAEQTAGMGYALGLVARGGDTFALSGELGAGKTCFTGGLARGLGVSDDYPITSPTFTLVNEYPGRCRLCHFDVYRLNSSDELGDIGFEEYVAGDDVVVIEWAEKIAENLPADAIHIQLNYLDESRRKILIRGPQKRVLELVKDINREV